MVKLSAGEVEPVAPERHRPSRGSLFRSDSGCRLHHASADHHQFPALFGRAYGG